MTFRKFLKKFSDIFFIPVIVAVICSMIFDEQLNTFKYAQIVRLIMVVVCIFGFVGVFIKDKKIKK